MHQGWYLRITCFAPERVICAFGMPRNVTSDGLCTLVFGVHGCCTHWLYCTHAALRTVWLYAVCCTLYDLCY